MEEIRCQGCGSVFPAESLYVLNGDQYCETCVRAASAQARQSGLRFAFTRLLQRPVCPRCSKEINSPSEAGQIGDVIFCTACGYQMQNWTYPLWLKSSLVALLLLLIVALATGRKYFHAGHELYRGEKLVEEGRNAEALPHLMEALRIAPNSDKASLLAAKAALLTGDVLDAQKALQGHNDGHFEDANDPQFREVNSLWERATKALEKADQAAKLEEQDGHEEEAARLIHEAASLYPQSPDLVEAVASYDSGVAFAKKDYDHFLAITKGQWERRPGAATAAALASALACKYAVSGDKSIRDSAEDMLARARQLAQKDPQEQKDLAEYEPRIRYRLESRQIITKAEYDRRFRPEQAAKTE